MGLLSKLIGLGAVAGTALAAVSVAKKYDAQKNAQMAEMLSTDDSETMDEVSEFEPMLFPETAEETPCADPVEPMADPVAVPPIEAVPEPEYDAMQDIEAMPEMEAAPSHARTILHDVSKAAGEVYGEVSGKVKDAAQKAGVDTDELTGAISGAGKALFNAGKAVATKVSAEAPIVLEKLKGQAVDVADQVRDQANDVADEMRDAVASVTETETLGDMPDETPDAQDETLL